jgi:hypothetical protein
VYLSPVSPDSTASNSDGQEAYLIFAHMSTAAATDTALGKETLPQILRLKLADGDHCFDASSAATAETVIEDDTDIGAILSSTAEDNDGVMRVEDCQESSADISGLRLCGCATEEGEVSTGGSGCDNHSAPSSIQYYYEDAIRSIVMHEGQIVPKRFRDSTNGEVFTAVVIPRRIPSQGTGTLASSAGLSSIHHQPARDPFFPYGSVKLVLSHHQMGERAAPHRRKGGRHTGETCLEEGRPGNAPGAP